MCFEAPFNLKIYSDAQKDTLEGAWQPTPVFLPEESQDSGAWWAAICGVAQSQTRLKRLSSSEYIGSSNLKQFN